MKKKLFLGIIAVLLFSCVTDRFQIKNNNRKTVFIPIEQDNYKGHLFWYYQRDDQGKLIKNSEGKKIIFDRMKDTIIFIHGWQGVGVMGWTQHSIMTGPGALLGPIAVLISVLYNTPDYDGADIPDLKQRADNLNVALFDWQNYNNIDGPYETSENLAELEKNLKNNPINWPSIPKNLAHELELFISKTDYKGNIYLVSHSIGNEVVLRAYSNLNDKYKEQVKSIILLEPFTTNYFDFLGAKLNSNPHWLSGSTNDWIAEDIKNLISGNNLNSKVAVIFSSDIGESWVFYIAKPLELKIINESKEFPVDMLYSYRIKKAHNAVLDWFFIKKKYDGELGLK